MNITSLTGYDRTEMHPIPILVERTGAPREVVVWVLVEAQAPAAAAAADIGVHLASLGRTAALPMLE
jgi:hypothetical protein